MKTTLFDTYGEGSSPPGLPYGTIIQKGCQRSPDLARKIKPLFPADDLIQKEYL
jgi:hypothetical protein